MGHYAIQFPLKKKDKDEKHDLQAATARFEEFTMIARISPGENWGDLEL